MDAARERGGGYTSSWLPAAVRGRDLAGGDREGATRVTLSLLLSSSLSRRWPHLSVTTPPTPPTTTPPPQTSLSNAPFRRSARNNCRHLCFVPSITVLPNAVIGHSERLTDRPVLNTALLIHAPVLQNGGKIPADNPSPSPPHARIIVALLSSEI